MALELFHQLFDFCLVPFFKLYNFQFFRLLLFLSLLLPKSNLRWLDLWSLWIKALAIILIHHRLRLNLHELLLIKLLNHRKLIEHWRGWHLDILNVLDRVGGIYFHLVQRWRTLTLFFLYLGYLLKLFFVDADATEVLRR